MQSANILIRGASGRILSAMKNGELQVHLERSQLLKALSVLSSSYIHTSSTVQKSSRSVYCYPLPTLESRPDDVKEKLLKMKEQTGFVPDFMLSLSSRPEEFRVFFEYYKLFMKDGENLTFHDKILIITATSAENNCLFCTIAHAGIHRAVSPDKELADQVAINWRESSINPRQRAILEFAMDICHCCTLTDEHFRKLEEHGLTMGDAWDICTVVSFFAMSNRRSTFLGVNPNKEFFMMGRS